MTSLLRSFHEYWGYVVALANGVVAIVAIVVAIRKAAVPRLLDAGFIAAFAAVYLQVAAGAFLWSRNLRPADTTHILYGITPAVGIMILIASYSQFKSRRALVLGVACLLIMGMSVRGIMTGSG